MKLSKKQVRSACGQVCDQIFDEIWSGAYFAVKNKNWNQIRARLSSLVHDQVFAQVQRQIWNQVRSQCQE